MSGELDTYQDLENEGLWKKKQTESYEAFAWNGPVCHTCNGSGAVIWRVNVQPEARICPTCNGSGLGKIGSSQFTIKLSEHSEPIGARK